jgi:hypothetical protein
MVQLPGGISLCSATTTLLSYYNLAELLQDFSATLKLLSYSKIAKLLLAGVFRYRSRSNCNAWSKTRSVLPTEDLTPHVARRNRHF